MQLPGRPSQQVFSGLGTSSHPANQVPAGGPTVPLVHVDGVIAGDKTLLAQAVSRIAIILRQVAVSAFANPFASSILVRNVSTTSGTPLVINHLLNRPIVSWTVLRPRGASWAGTEATTQPSYIDVTKQILINPTSTGTYDFLFC